MMLISIIVLKFESTDKLDEIDDEIMLKTMKTWNCQFQFLAYEDIENMR